MSSPSSVSLTESIQLENKTTQHSDRVFLLGRAFERGGGGHGSQGGPLSLGQQKAELDGLLDAISFSIAISEAQPSLSLSSLPPDPVVAARK